jgi:hypothetical protein
LVQEYRDVRIGDVVLQVSADMSDVAACVLDCIGSGDRIGRTTLRAVWRQRAPELNEQASTRQRDKGLVTSHKLKNYLVRMEQAGVLRRDSDTDSVIVIDRGLLAAIANAWD